MYLFCMGEKHSFSETLYKHKSVVASPGASFKVDLTLLGSKNPEKVHFLFCCDREYAA